MTLDQIKQAVNEGKTVHWATTNYVVAKNGNGPYLIRCQSNGHCIGLTWKDGKTMNGEEKDFFEAE